MKLIRKFESYMSREEMCNVLCRYGYNISELEMCSTHELEEMCRSVENDEEDSRLHNNTMTQEKKSEKWIQDTKMKKGALHKQLGYDEDEKIPDGILKKISNATVGSKIEVKGKEKTITSLLKKRANLAKTLKGLKEHQETQNYMFFGNLRTIKRLVDELLEMDESKLDEILKEHNWALDHIATSKDDIEEVFNFLAGHESPEGTHHEDEHTYEEPSHEETEGHLANKDLEDEMKNIKSFGNFGK